MENFALALNSISYQVINIIQATKQSPPPFLFYFILSHRSFIYSFMVVLVVEVPGWIFFFLFWALMQTQSIVGLQLLDELGGSVGPNYFEDQSTLALEFKVGLKIRPNTILGSCYNYLNLYFKDLIIFNYPAKTAPQVLNDTHPRI